MSTTEGIHARGITDAGTFKPDRLIAGDTEFLKRQKGTIRLAANTKLPRGTLLGRLLTTAVAAVANPDNTGGAIMGDVSVDRYTRPGTYTVRCTTLGNAANARYQVLDPEGQEIASALESGTALDGTVINLEPTHAGVNAAVGDEWYVDVVPASKWLRSLLRARDFSSIPESVLAISIENDGAAAADISCEAFTGGIFDGNEVFAQTGGDTGHTLASVRTALGQMGVQLLDSDVFEHDALDTDAILT